MTGSNKPTKKQYHDLWQEFRDNIRNATPVDVNETPEQKRLRMQRLEKDGNEEEWFKYYFPDFAEFEAADFHRKATRRIIRNPEWYEIRNWSRELAKSTRSMMEDFYLFFVGHPTKKDGIPGKLKKNYKILISSTNDAAQQLMLPYKVNLEDNARLINDYGVQQKIGSWHPDHIVTKSGFAIKAFGIDQKPRGTRNKQRRPDIIEFDDFDTDEACLNEERVDKYWKWANKAAIGTRSIDKPTLIRWNGNVIAEDCCIVRAQEFADHVDLINITDAAENSSWPEKYSNDDVKRVLSKIPFSAQQSEYYNNPYTEGKSFKSINWGKVPPLSRFPYLVAYGDPSTSNKDKGKGNSKSSMKALVLVGLLNQVYYVIKCRLNRMKNADFVDSYYVMENYVNGKAQLFSYIENNSLQDPFYEQVFLPLFFQKSKEFRRMISIIPDASKKPDKYTRIEGTLEPIHRLKCLVFNEKEKEDEDMKRLALQLLSVNPMSRTMDGPDALTGAVVMTNARIAYTGGIELFERPENKQAF